MIPYILDEQGYVVGLSIHEIRPYCERNGITKLNFKKRARKIERALKLGRVRLRPARPELVEPDDSVWDEMLAAQATPPVSPVHTNDTDPVTTLFVAT